MDRRELTIVRVFEAPRALVFKAWTDPEMVKAWWGPHGFSTPDCEWDARPGGRIRLYMKASDEIAKMIGPGHWMGGEFNEVVPPERLVFTSTALENERGEPGLQNLNTLTFEDLNGKTRMTLHVEVLVATEAVAPALAGMETGWNQSLDKLAALLAAQ